MRDSARARPAVTLRVATAPAAASSRRRPRSSASAASVPSVPRAAVADIACAHAWSVHSTRGYPSANTLHVDAVYARGNFHATRYQALVS